MAPLPSSQRIRLLEGIAFVFVACHAAISLTRIIHTLAPDFSVLYQSAQNLLAGTSLYDDPTLYTGLGYPQVSLLPFIPFTWLPYAWAQAIWVVGSFTAFGGVCYLSLHMARRYSFRAWCAVMSIAFLAFPTKFTFGMGQANYYALYFLLLGISTLPLSGLVRTAALVLALLLKPHLVFVYVGLLLTHHRLTVIKSFVVVLLAIGILGYLTQWKNDIVYISQTLPGLMRFDGRELYYNQGIGAGVARLIGDAGRGIATALSILVAIVSYASIWIRKKISPVYVVAVLLPMQVLIEPLAWQHHLIFLLPVCVLLWFGPKKSMQRDLLVFTAIVLVGWNIKNPLYWQVSALGNLILSHGLVGLILIWYMARRYL